MDYEGQLELVRDHLEDCLEFKGFMLEKNPVDFSTHLVCTVCNTEWKFDDLKTHELTKFVQSANMMAHAIREKSKKNIYETQDYKDTVCVPLMGFCIDHIDLEGDNYG
jgi:hypothetical protein